MIVFGIDRWRTHGVECHQGVELEHHTTNIVRISGYQCLWEGEWFNTHEEAVERVKKLRDDKINELENELIKLNEMEFL